MLIRRRVQCGHSPGREQTLLGGAALPTGAAISRIDANTNAAAHRDAAYVLNIQAAWEALDETERYTRWTRDLLSAMQPFSTGGVYVNFLSEDEGSDRIRAAYGDRYERLVMLKQRYDPTNLFHINQNIRPDG